MSELRSHPGYRVYFCRRGAEIVILLGGGEKFSRQTGLSREAIYKGFAPGGNPTLDTLTKATQALGLRLTVKPAASATI